MPVNRAFTKATGLPIPGALGMVHGLKYTGKSATHHWLVLWNFSMFPTFGNFIIPTGEL